MKQVDIEKWIELGVLRERQRIIKLLEEHDAAIIRDNLIALIKGEK